MTRALAMLLTLAGCAAPAPPDPVLAVPPIPPAGDCVPAKPLPQISTAAAAATRDYRKAEGGIGPALTDSAATARDINAIARADAAARGALARLVAQGSHPTAGAIAAWRRSLDELTVALGAHGP